VPHARLVVALLVALALAGPLARLGADDLPPTERAGLARVAGEWRELGAWAISQGLHDEARGCLERATEAQAEAPDLAALRRDLEASRATPSDADRKRWDQKRQQTARAVAGLWDRLSALAAQGSAPARAATYGLRAVDAHATPRRWEALERLLAAPGVDAAAADLAARALALGPPAEARPRLEETALLATTSAPALRAARGHPMRYWLSVPRGWRRAAGPWAVLVAVEGAGCNFEGMARGYVGARGARPLVVVTPCGTSNTNAIEGELRARYEGWYGKDELDRALRDRLAWDMAGLLAVLDDLKADVGAADRAAITGFSGGGLLTYAMLLGHPGRLRAAAPACGNFNGRGPAAPPPPSELGLPVLLLTGADDPHREFTFGDKGQPGIEPQTDAAEALLRRLGYTSVRRTQVPGLAHDPACAKVLEFLDGL
jgi:poly(3-hydroxybutyrate) depolymerase